MSRTTAPSWAWTHLAPRTVRDVPHRLEAQACVRLRITRPLLAALAAGAATISLLVATPSVAGDTATSPDWFVGVAKLDLCDGERWVAGRRVTLHVYEAGTDRGTTYQAPDLDTQPREPIRRIEASPFRIGSELRPAGTLTFTRR